MVESLTGLSAVMIARDAERYLATALAALAEVADETVVVDTGSSDATAAIARHFGCRVFSFPWCHDFSRAKNFAVEQARRRWILSVDADEVLDASGAADELAAAMADEAIPAYLIYQDNLYDDGSVKPNPVLRLFRNDPRIRFVNPVHECISGTLFASWPGLKLSALDIHLRHSGYLGTNLAGKVERNLAILERWVAAEPGHIFANFKLGGQLFDLGRTAEALRYLQRVFALFSDPRYRRVYPFLPTFIVVYHRALLASGDKAQAGEFERTATEWLKEEE
jgi:glycosyltransferase involved in cell wall biosynthesis